VEGWKRNVRCPRCHAPIWDLQEPSCSSAACEYSRAAFPVVDGQPVLIDFAASIFHRSAYQVDNGSVIERDVAKLSIGSRLHRVTSEKIRLPRRIARSSLLS